MEYEGYIIRLHSAAEPDYAEFQKRIVSDTEYLILGVRMPVLRKLARQAAMDNWRAILREIRYESYEEVMLCGLMIAYAPIPLAEKLPVLQRYLPYIDTWAMTDSIVPTLPVRTDELPLLWRFAKECISNDNEYTIRFGIVVMMRFFLTEEWLPQVAACLVRIRDERYYVNMAVAWCLAEMAVHNYEMVTRILQDGCLDSCTHQKAIQKMRESYRFTEEQKASIWLLRRK